MTYLSVVDVIHIHDNILLSSKGSAGIRDRAALESAVMRMRSSFGGKELYPDIFLKAASLLHSIVKNHPFVDGNKRSAIASASIFLMINGYSVHLDVEKTVKFMVIVAGEVVPLDSIAEFLRNHSNTI